MKFKVYECGNSDDIKDYIMHLIISKTLNVKKEGEICNIYIRDFFKCI